jgi:hypothetical protein
LEIAKRFQILNIFDVYSKLDYPDLTPLSGSKALEMLQQASHDKVLYAGSLLQPEEGERESDRPEEGEGATETGAVFSLNWI